VRATSKRHVILTIQAFDVDGYNTGLAKGFDDVQANIVNKELMLPSHMLYERVEEAVGTVWRQVCQDLLKRLEDVPI
jgi:hypothetical protein